MLPERGFPMFLDEFSLRESAVSFYQRLCDDYPDRSFLLVRGIVVSYRFKGVY